MLGKTLLGCRRSWRGVLHELPYASDTLKLWSVDAHVNCEVGYYFVPSFGTAVETTPFAHPAAYMTKIAARVDEAAMRVPRSDCFASWAAVSAPEHFLNVVERKPDGLHR